MNRIAFRILSLTMVLCFLLGTVYANETEESVSHDELEIDDTLSVIPSRDIELADTEVIIAPTSEPEITDEGIDSVDDPDESQEGTSQPDEIEVLPESIPSDDAVADDVCDETISDSAADEDEALIITEGSDNRQPPSYVLHVPTAIPISFGCRQCPLDAVTVSDSIDFAEGDTLCVTVKFDGHFSCSTASTVIPYSLIAVFEDSTQYSMYSGNTLYFTTNEDGTVARFGRIAGFDAPVVSFLVEFPEDVWNSLEAGEYTTLLHFEDAVEYGEY